MRKIIQKEEVITRLGEEVEITLIEDIDEEMLEIGLDSDICTIYAVKVKSESWYMNDYKVYSRKTNAEKSYKATLSKIKNLYVY